MPSWRSLTKIAGSGPGSGSVPKCHAFAILLLTEGPISRIAANYSRWQQGYHEICIGTSAKDVCTKPCSGAKLPFNQQARCKICDGESSNLLKPDDLCPRWLQPRFDLLKLWPGNRAGSLFTVGGSQPLYWILHAVFRIRSFRKFPDTRSRIKEAPGLHKKNCFDLYLLKADREPSFLLNTIRIRVRIHIFLNIRPMHKCITCIPRPN